MERPHLAVINHTRSNPIGTNPAVINQAAIHQAVINPTPPPDKPRYFALSRTTDRVLQILLGGDLARLRADSVAESLGMSSTTLRRRLRADHTCYQFLLDRARQYRCEQQLRDCWLPGKCRWRSASRHTCGHRPSRRPRGAWRAGGRRRRS